MSDAKSSVESMIRECLIQTHEHLRAAEDGSNQGLHNLREELSGRFQGCNMVVASLDWMRDERGTFDVDVKWTDGPSVPAVMGYCGRFAGVVLDKEGRRKVMPETAWRKTFGSVGAVTPRRSLSSQRTRMLLEFMAKKFGAPFDQMAQYAVGGEIPIAENVHMEQMVEFSGRGLRVKDLLGFARRAVSWEGDGGRAITMDGARWDP